MYETSRGLTDRMISWARAQCQQKSDDTMTSVPRISKGSRGALRRNSTHLDRLAPPDLHVPPEDLRVHETPLERRHRHDSRDGHKVEDALTLEQGHIVQRVRRVSER